MSTIALQSLLDQLAGKTGIWSAPCPSPCTSIEEACFALVLVEKGQILSTQVGGQESYRVYYSGSVALAWLQEQELAWQYTPIAA
jgi:hypothetical protein